MTDNLLCIPNPMYRCAGPNCGILKGSSDRWWVMWSSIGARDLPVMNLAPWDDQLALQQDMMPVCGEGCAQRLQSQFMGNILQGQSRRASG